MASSKSTTKKKVQQINLTGGDEVGDRPCIPQIGRIGPSKIWDAAQARQYDGEVKDLAEYIASEFYRKLASALGDEVARDLQGEEKFAAAEQVIADNVAEAEEGRIRESLILRLGRAMVVALAGSVLGLLHIGNHGLQIGLFRRPTPGEKGLTVDLPVGTMRRWEWVTLMSPIPGGNEIVGSLRPITDAGRAKLQCEEAKLAAARLEVVKANVKNFTSVMRAGKGRATCYVAPLNRAPECWLDVTLSGNQIRVFAVGAGNSFQQSLAGIAIPVAALEAGRFTYNMRQALGEKLRRAEYLLVSVLDAVKRIPKPSPGKPAVVAAPEPEPEK